MSNTRLKTSIIKQFNSQIKELKLSDVMKKRLFELFEDFIAWKHNFGAWSESEVDDFVSTRRDNIDPKIIQHLKNYLRHSSFDEIQVFLLEFLDKLTTKKVTEKTIRNYRSDIKQFIKSAKSTTLANLLTREKLDNFVNNQLQKGLKSSSINRKLSSITRFAQFIEQEMIIKNDLSWLTGYGYKPLEIKTSAKSSPFSGEDAGTSVAGAAGEAKTPSLTSHVLPKQDLSFSPPSGENFTDTDLNSIPSINLSTGEALETNSALDAFDKSRIDHETLSSEERIAQAQAIQMRKLKKTNLLQTAFIAGAVFFLFSFQSLADFASREFTRTNPNSLISQVTKYAARPWTWFTDKQEIQESEYLAQNIVQNGGTILGAKEDLTKSKLLFHIPTNFKAGVEALSLSIAETLAVAGDTNLAGNLAVAGETTLTGDTTLQNNLQVDGNANVDGNLTVAGTSVLTGATTLNTTTINGPLTLTQDVTADGVNVDLGAGTLTAGNVVYTLTAGNGLTVSGTQDVTISLDSDSDASTINSFSTIDANGTEVTASGNDDTLILAAADNLTISGSGSTITFGVTNIYGWEDSGTAVALTTATDLVGIGTAAPVAQLHVGAGTPGNVSGADDVYITGDLEVDGTIYGSISGSITTGFDEGSVVFTDNSGNLAADSNNFYWDDSNNYLGIGTSSPSYPLDVDGAANVSGSLSIGNTASVAGNLTVAGTANITGNFTVNGNSLFVNASTNRVGIGTGSPDNTLHVAGDVKIDTISPGATNTVLTHSGGVIETRTVDSRVWGSSLVDYSGSSNATYLAYFTDNDTLTASSLYASSSYIGLGTTSPSYSFDVYHATDDILAQFQSADALAGIQVTDSSNTAYFLTQDNLVSIGLTDSLSTSNININTSGFLGIGTTNPGAGLHVGAGTPGSVSSIDDAYIAGDLEVDGVIYGSISGSINPGLTSGSVVFIDNLGALAEDNGNFYWDDSNNYLGIGTSSPTSSLDVAGTTYLRGASGQTGVYVGSSGYLNIGNTAQVVGLQVGSGTPGNASGADSAYVTGDLEVDGTIYANVTGSVNIGLTAGSILFANSTGVIAGDSENFYWQDSTNRLGLGNTNPNYVLDIYSSDNFLTQFQSIDALAGIILTDSSDSAYLLTQDSILSLGLTDSLSANNININSSGYLGIGVTNPSTPLEVNGTASATTFTDGTASLNSGILDLGTNTIYDGNMTGNWAFNAGSLSDIYDLTVTHDLTVDSNTLYVDADQNFVGIGTTSPSSQFDIDAKATSGTIFNFAYGSATTLTGDTIGAKFNMDDGNVTATNQNVTGLNIKLPTVTNTHTSGTKTLRGFYVDFGTGSGINQNGVGGTTVYNAAEFVLPSLTESAGSLNVNGLKITTPTSITTGGTASGINISPNGVGAGSLYGVQIGDLTAGAGSEIAYYVGTGWDSVLTIGNTTIINGSGVTQVAGGGTGYSSYAQGDILYASAADTLSRLSIGNTTGYVLSVGAGGVPTWGTISGSACTNCLVSDPSSDQIITPTGDTTGLSIRQTATISPTADIFSITNNAGDNKYLYVDSSGTVYIPNLGSESSADQITIEPGSDKFALRLLGTNVTSADLMQIDAYNTSGTLIDLGYNAATSLAGSLTGLDLDLDTNLTATNQDVTAQKITLPDFTNTHTSGTHYYYGLQITPPVGSGINQNGSGGTTQYNLLDLTMPALTQTAGTLNSYGIDLTTPSSITTGGTAYGININPTGIANGTLRGVSIGDITAGSGSEIANYIGTGWDYGVYSATAGNNYFAGYVGIGTTTTSASYKLTVSGNMRASAYYDLNNTDYYINPSSTSIAGVFQGNIGIMTTNPLSPLSVAGGASIGSSYIGYTAPTNSLIVEGSLGIGTTSPSYKLDVNSSTTDSVARFISSDDLAQILISDNDTTSYINSKDSTMSLGLNSGLSTSNLNINSSGYVGIGVTSPSTALHVLNTSTQLRLAYDSDSYTNFTVGSDGNLVIAPNGTTAMTIRDSKITSHVPHEFLASGDVSMAYDLIMTNQTSSSIESYGPLSLIAGESYESNDLTLTTYNYGDIVLNMEDGNLVIGATSPSIVFDNSTSGETDFWMGIIGIGDTSDNDKLSIGDGSTPGSNSYLTIDTSGQVGIGTTSPTTRFQVNASGSSAFSVNSSGEVGIGTTAPSYQLQVVSGDSIAASFDGRVIGVDAVNTDEFVTLGQMTTGGAGLWTRVSASSNTYLSNLTDQVGIGTTDPDYTLELSAATSSNSNLALSDGDIAHGLTTLAQTDTYGLFEAISGTSGGLQISGISDTNAQALQLKGIISSTDPTDTIPAIKLVGAKSDGSTGAADLGSSETVFSIANNDNDPSMVITGNGYVGIGTTNPSALFSVGTASAFQVNSSGAVTAPKVNKVVVVDGTTYAQTCAGINAAIDALGASGGEVYLPEGTYTCAETINIDAHNTTIRGAGYSTYINAAGQNLSPVINANAYDYLTFEDFRVQASTGGSGGHTIDGLNSDNIRINRLYVINSDNIAINLYGGDNAVITNNYISQADSNGISILRTANNVISNNYIAGCTSGVSVSSPTGDPNANARITNNTFVSNTTAGVYFFSFTNATVTGNTFESNLIGVDIAANVGYTMHYLTVTGNSFSDGNYAMRMANLDYSTISSNVISDAAIAGIYLYSQPNTHDIITNNTIQNSVIGIKIDSGVATDITIANNNFQDNSTTNISDAGGGNTISTIYVADGVVGIGTTSPSYRLDVNSSTTDIVTRFASSDDLAQILISDNDTTSYINSKDSTLSIGLTSGLSTSNLNIDSSGNLGIGVTTPSYALHVVSGDAIAASFDGRVIGVDAVNTDEFVTLGQMTTGGSALWTRDSGNSYTYLTNTSDNVGIGTTSPSQALDVVGSIKTSANLYAASATTVNIGTGDVASTINLATESTTADIINIGNDNSSTTLSLTGGDDWSISSTGVGTFTQANIDNLRLDGNTLSSTSGAINLTPLSGQNLNISLATTGDFVVNTDDLYVDTSTGNVGIGTTSPSYRLDVNSSTTDSVARFASSDDLAQILISDNDTTSYINSKDSTLSIGLTSGLSTSNLNINNSGYVGIGTTAPTSLLDIGGFGSPVSGSVARVGITDNYNGVTGVQMYNSSTGASADFRFTVADQSKSNYISFVMPSKNNTASNLFGSARSTSAYIVTNNLGAEAIRNLTIGTANGADLIFGTNNIENLRIKNGGNVGIGTTSPSYQLQVVSGDDIAASFDGRVIGSDAVNTDEFVTLGQMTTGGSALWTRDSGNSYTYLTNTSDNVGIGTTVPSYKTQITGGTGGADTNLLTLHSNSSDNATGTTLRFVNSTDVTASARSVEIAGIRTSAISNDLVFRTSNGTSLSEQMRLTGAGYLGIGTTSPSNTAHIYKNASIGFWGSLTTANAGLRIQDSATSMYLDGNSLISNGALYLGTSNSSDIHIGTNDAERLTILSTGNVGIGTTSPGSKLSVAGAGAIGSTYSLVAAPTNGLIVEGNVGIGTTSPTYKFEIAGISETGLSINPGANGPVIRTVAGGANNRLYIQPAAGTTYFNTTGVNNTVYLYDSSSNLDVQISSGGYTYFNAGNVGIGTTSPSYQLQVVSGDSIAASFDGRVIGSDAVNTDEFVTLGQMTTGGSALWTRDSGNSYTYLTNTSDNVGIGTTSPSSKLEIAGNIKLGETYKAIFNNTAADNIVLEFRDNNAAVHSFVTAYSGTGANGNDLILNSDTTNSIMVWERGGNVGIGTTAPLAKLSVAGNGIFGSTYIGYTAPTNGLVVEGNVGIGVTNPQATLHVNTSGSVGAGYHSEVLVAETSFSVDEYHALTFRDDSNNTNYAAVFGGASGSGIFDLGLSAQDNIRFFSGGNYGFASEVMRINSSGNVGIGTTAPSYRLDVNSGTTDSVARFASSDDLAQILISDNDTTSYINSKDSTLSIGLTSGLSTSNLNINSSGYVGIGTTAPLAKLSVAGNGIFGSTYIGYTAPTNGLLVEGNVGIGTTGPGGKLHVKTGSSGVSAANAVADELVIEGSGNSGLSILTPNTSTAYIMFADPEQNSAGFIAYQQSDNAMRFATNTTERMRINSAGNVGIGITDITYRLDISTSADSVARFASSDDLAQILLSDDDTTSYINSKDSTMSLGLNSGLSTSNLNINSSGQVGIGTTNPAVALQIAGSTVRHTGSSTTYNDVFSSGSADAIIRLGASSNPVWSMGNDATSNDFVIAQTSNLDSNQLFVIRSSTNNVGIGTTSPSYRLDVNSSTTDAVARFSSSDDLAQILLSDNDTTSYFNSKDSTLSIGLTSGLSSSNLNITSAGSVGIGLTNPTAKLGILSTTEQLRLSYDTDSYTSFTVGSDGNLVIAPNGTTAMTIRDSKITSHVPHEFLASGDVSMAYDLIMTNQTSSSIESYGPLSLIAGESYESNDLTLTTYNYGDIVLNMEDGNLVIGATSPSIVFDNSTSGETDFWMGIIGIGDTSDNDKLSIGDGSTPGSNSYLTIDTSGQVGIGTTSPAYTLEVYDATDDFLTEFQSGDALAGIQITDSSDTAYLLTQDSTLSIGMTNSLSNSNVNINSSGYLGIGATNPTTPLHVVAASGNIATFDNGAGSGCTLSDGGVITCSSDERLKKDVENIGSAAALDLVNQLQAIKYHDLNENSSDEKHLGFIAQDVELVAPELVTENIGGYKGISYDRVAPLLVGAVQELSNLQNSQTASINTQLDSFTDTLGNLSAQISDLTQTLTQVQDDNNTLSANLAAIEEELTTNRLAVGTTASSELAMVVEQASSDNSIALINNPDASSSASVLALQVGAQTPGLDNAFISFKNGAGEIIGQITGNETGGVSYSTSGADFAEYFPKVDPDEVLEPGDIVCLHSLGGVTKCTSSSPDVERTSGEQEANQIGEADNIIGVVSEHAGFVGNSEHADSPNYVLVGLLGQLPVKINQDMITSRDAINRVSTGIQPGDPLTVGKDGLAVKATKAGYIIGKVISSPKGESVLTYVNPSYYIGDLNSNGNLANSSPSGRGHLAETSEDQIGEAAAGEGEVETDLFTRLESSLKTSLGLDDDKNKVAALETEIADLKTQIAQITEKISTSELPQTQLLNSDAVVTLDEAGAVLGTSTVSSPSGEEAESLAGGADTAGEVSESPLLSGSPVDTGENQMFSPEGESSPILDLGYSLVINKTLQVQQLMLGGESGNMISSTQTLELQPYGQAGIELVAGQVVIDEDGNMVVAGDLAVQGSVSTSKLQISEPSPSPSGEDAGSSLKAAAAGEVNSASLGSATITAGNKATIISTTAFTQNSKVFTSLTSSAGGQALIVVTPENDGIPAKAGIQEKDFSAGDQLMLKQALAKNQAFFMIKIDEAQNTNINFDWWIVDAIKNKKTNSLPLSKLGEGLEFESPLQRSEDARGEVNTLQLASPSAGINY